MKRIKYLALAALVGVWACSSDTTAPEITGTISGTVSIEGTGAAGITVSLSSGASTTTDGSGQYQFTDIPGGAYTVTISDFPTDVTFSSTSKAAAIVSAKQVVPVDFSGSYIRTASILGTVAAGGTGLAGVSVAAVGPGGTQNKVTDANGNFSMTGLRAGSYAVTISNIPTGYTFTTTSQTITVAAGATEQVVFSGSKAQDEVTASVVIAGLTNNAGGAVDPSNVAGQLNVKLQIDPGTNQLSKVCILLDNVEVANGCQTLSSAVAAMGGPQAATVLEPVFTILTGSLKADGSPNWLNGAHTLSARLDLTNATQANVTTSQTLTFANVDKVMLQISPTVGPEIGGDGLAWYGGDVTVTGTPALYSGGSVASMTMCLNKASGVGTVPACIKDSAAPFSATFPKSSTTADDLSDWSSNSVTASATTVLAAGSNGPSGTSSSIRLDEVGPDFSVALPASVIDSWLGSNFTFKSTGTSATVTGLTDPNGANGSGSPSVTFHATTSDNAADDDDEIAAANAAITDVKALANTLSNSAYILVVKGVDAVGNETYKRMAGGFGVDLVAPTFTVASGSTKDKAINPTAGVALNLTDDYSGLGTNPVSLQIVKRTIVSGSTKTQCVNQTNTVIGDGDDVPSNVPSSGACAFTTLPASTSFSWNTTNNAYYWVTWRASDKAGNFSTTDSRNVLLDTNGPTVTVTGFSISGNTVSASDEVTDNLDIAWWDTRLFFGSGMNLPVGTATTISDFGEPLVGDATANGSATMIKGILDYAGATWDDMAGVGFGAFDVAQQFASASFASAQAHTGIGVTLVDFALDNPDICLSGATSSACTTPNPDVPESVTVTLTAKVGPTVDNPFPTNGVYFYVVSAGGVTYALGHTTAASFTTDASNRYWKWSMSLSKSQLPFDITATTDVMVYAVAVENDLDAVMAKATLDVF